MEESMIELGNFTMALIIAVSRETGVPVAGVVLIGGLAIIGLFFVTVILPTAQGWLDEAFKEDKND